MPIISDITRAGLEEILETAIRPIPQHWLAIQFDGQTIGHIQPDYIPTIEHYIEQSESGVLARFGDHLQLEKLPPFLLSQELSIFAEFLKNAGLAPGWRNEVYAWIDLEGHERFRMERAVFRSLGLHSRAVHINGYTQNKELWLGKRSSLKPTDPNMLDNLAAGGLAADETFAQCAIRELWEEAGVPTGIAQWIDPVGQIDVRRVVEPKGLHDETLYTFDLLLDDDFVPQNNDGEVADFIKLPYAEIAELILKDQLTPDAAAVTAEFILRQVK